MELKFPGMSSMHCNCASRTTTPCGKMPWLWRSRHYMKWNALTSGTLTLAEATKGQPFTWYLTASKT
eukprot:11424609-Ditylum_brightwellii.AAC.1